MTRGDVDRLRDIADAIAAIRSYLDRADRADPLLHDALQFRFVVIGEAVKALSAETREREPEVPWTSIAGLRDLIAHEYFQVKPHRLLDVVDRDLPPLERSVARLIGA